MNNKRISITVAINVIIAVILILGGPQVPREKDSQDLGCKSDQTTGQPLRCLVCKTSERKKDPSGTSRIVIVLVITNSNSTSNNHNNNNNNDHNNDNNNNNSSSKTE